MNWKPDYLKLSVADISREKLAEMGVTFTRPKTPEEIAEKQAQEDAEYLRRRQQNIMSDIRFIESREPEYWAIYDTVTANPKAQINKLTETPRVCRTFALFCRHRGLKNPKSQSE